MLCRYFSFIRLRTFFVYNIKNFEFLFYKENEKNRVYIEYMTPRTNSLSIEVSLKWISRGYPLTKQNHVMTRLLNSSELGFIIKTLIFFLKKLHLLVTSQFTLIIGQKWVYMPVYNCPKSCVPQQKVGLSKYATYVNCRVLCSKSLVHEK